MRRARREDLRSPLIGLAYEARAEAVKSGSDPGALPFVPSTRTQNRQPSVLDRPLDASARAGAQRDASAGPGVTFVYRRLAAMPKNS